MFARRSLAVAAVTLVCALALGAVAYAGESILRGTGDMKLAVSGGERVRLPDGPLAVRGTIRLAPHAEELPGNYTIFVVDDRSEYSTNDPMPAMELDTTALSEGPHTVRVDSLDGSRRVASTGDITLEVANQAVLSQLGQAGAGQPAFVKLHHKKILREVVWFNGREGDLEKHGTIRNGHILITLTDLMRHIGGTVDWGPPSTLVLATRGDVTVRVVPGSRTAYVNGQPRSMPVAAFRTANRTWVPVRAMCNFYGVRVDWDYYTDRAYLTYQMD